MERLIIDVAQKLVFRLPARGQKILPVILSSLPEKKPVLIAIFFICVF